MFTKHFFALFLLFKSIHAIHDDSGGRRKKIGEMCLRDSNCDSKYCSKAKCARKPGTPIGSRGYPMNLDTDGLFWVPRKVIDTPVNYDFIRYSLDDEANDGLKVTATEVHFPLNKNLQGEFATGGPATGFKESGIVNIICFKNELSVLTEDPLVACGEKFHTVEERGNPNTRSADKANKEMASRTKLQNKQAARVRSKRDSAASVHAEVSGIGNKLVEAAKDYLHFNQMYDFVKEDGGKKGVGQLLTSEKFSSLKETAKKARTLSETKPSIRAKNTCRHYEKKSPIRLTDTHAIFPLETNIVALAGKAQLSPSRWVEFFFGHSVFKYNKEENALEFIQVFTSGAHMNFDLEGDSKGLPQSALYVGPADGMNMAVSSVDGREDKFYEEKMSAALKAALVLKNSFPIDYRRMYKDPQKVCTDSKRKTLQYSIYTGLKDGLSMGRGKKPHEAVWQSLNFFRAISQSVDCGIAYLRTPLKYSTGFDMLEIVVWGHFLMEADMDNKGKNAADLTLNSHFWDDGVILESFDDLAKTNEVEFDDDLAKTNEDVMYLRNEKTD